MTNKKSTKRALLLSILSLVMCVSMLIGSTFAWFTDSVTSEGNIIKSGKLDVEMYWADGTKAIPAADSADWKDASTGAMFTEDQLWEPGYTDVKHIKISNEGNLALKYQLNIFANGSVSELADVIDVYYADPAQQVADRTALKAEMKIGTLTEVLAKLSTTASGELLADEEVIITLALKMKETAGNKYQEMSIGSDFTVQLMATQLTSEFDSFDETYDQDAIYTDVVVTSEAELKEALANVKDGAVIGIKGNVTWTTGAEHGSTPFVESATTYSLRAATPVRNITFLGMDETATFTAIGAGVGPVGIDGGTVTFKNLKIVDNSVSYAESSWEFGYLEFRGNTVFENCEVVSAIMMEGDSATFKNCSFNSNNDNEYAVWVSNGNASFENCTLTGARGLKMHEAYGSEVGTVVINNNKFIDLSKKPGLAIGTVNSDTTVTLTNNEFLGTQPGDQGNYKYESDTDITTFNMTEDKNLVAGYAANTNDLKETIKDAKSGDTIVVASGEISMPSMAEKEGLTIVGSTDGSTVVGGETVSTGFGSNFGKNTTIKNVTFSGSTNGVRWSYANGGISTFDNCTFAGDSTYGFHIDESNGATFIFNNCTFSGFNAFAGDLEKVVFNNCTFLNNGNYGHTNIHSIAEFNACIWGDKTSVSPAKSYAKLYFDGVEESYHHEYIGSAESLFAFAKSVNEGNDSWSGQKIVLVSDIDLKNATWTPVGQTGATEFKGIFDGQGNTIKNLNVDSSAQTGEHYSSGLFGWVEGKVTIKNVNIDGATVKGNHNVAALLGYTYSAQISNCHVSNATIVCNHANGDACGDKAGTIVGYAGDESRFTNCSASDSTVTAGRDAGQIIGTGYNVSVSNCTATNVTVAATGNCDREANINNNIIGRVMG